jgi:hypothetical protein
MKYLPKKYRESQSEWFGKRGISWHITVAARLNDGKFETETLVHVFESCSQDSIVVAGIMQHVVEEIQRDCPGIKEMYYRSDNAACYHNATVLQSVPSICKRYDFSEPQGGKGPCDRMAATIKGHIAIYISEGNDVDSAESFKKAVESNGGVAGVKVYLCESTEKLTVAKPIDKITQYTNFEFKEDGICAWKAYNIGEPTIIPAHTLERVKVSNLKIKSNSTHQGSTFKVVQPRRQKQAEKSETEVSIHDSSSEMTDHRLFTCPEEGCIMTFMKVSNLNNHLICGKHQKALDSYMP